MSIYTTWIAYQGNGSDAVILAEGGDVYGKFCRHVRDSCGVSLDSFEVTHRADAVQRFPLQMMAWEKRRRAS